MRDKKKRHGIKEVMKMAEFAVMTLAPSKLSHLNYTRLKSEIGKGLFTAGNFPEKEWEGVVGFEPDSDFYYQVTIGVGSGLNQSPTIFAKALISRDESEDWIYIEWLKD